MRRDVRIVLVGDEDSGKSSLITSLIKESFVDRVQPVLPEISLPPEVAPEGVLTKIIDTSSTAANRAHLEAEIRRSNVICIVYSISAPTSFDRIPTYWLPYIRSLGVNVPVILVGNKIDLRSGSVTNSALEDELSPVMAEFKEVETCVECSAKQQLNVSEVFYFAQKAVVYPTAPLYDSREHRLKPSCVDALRRIFRLCDSDKDSLLNDNELNDFQRKCFDSPLQSQELEGIKDLVLQAPIEGNNRFPYDHLSAYGGSNASHPHHHQHQQENGSTSSSSTRNQNHPHLRRGSLTLAGFLYLHTLFIQRGRLETTWTVLRTFGYGFDLTLEDSFVRPQFQVPADCSVELSPHGYQFLTDVFEVHDKDRDGALSKKELESLFLTAPEGKHPFGNRDLGGSSTSTMEGDESFPNNTTITDENGYVTLQGWLAQWSMLTLLDHKTTLAYLAYLGYPSFPLSTNHLNDSSNPNSNSNGTNTSGSKFSFGKRGPPTPISLNSSSSKNSVKPSPPDTTSALKITKPRKLDRKKKGKIQRNVLLAYVLGAPGSGKTSILRHMIGSGEIDDGDYWEKGYEPTNGVQSVVSTVEHMGAEKYLVLQEFGSRSKEEVEILRSAQKLSLADVILYVYDSSDTNSFSYISNLRQQYPLLNNLPCLFVATKADLDLAQQRHEVQPDVYCQKLGLNIPSLINSTSTNSIHNLNGNGSNNNFSGPLSISVKFNQTADLYHIICSIALDPRGSVPFGNDRSLSYSNSRSRFLFYVGIVLLGGGVAFYSFKVISPGTGGLGLGLGKWKDAFGNYNYATTGGENTSNAGGSKWLSWLRSGM